MTNDLIRSLAMLATPQERNSGDASIPPPVEFKPTRSRAMHNGESHVYAFPNGWAASVVRHDYSYGHETGLWEIAVGTYNDEGDFHLDYSTPITDDVLGYQSDADLARVLIAVAGLPAVSA